MGGRRAADHRARVHGDLGETGGVRDVSPLRASEPRSIERKAIDVNDTDIDELGPVDYLVVEFPPGVSHFTGEMAAELAKLVDAGTIRILDLIVLVKDENGKIDALELDDLDDVGRASDGGDPVGRSVSGGRRGRPGCSDGTRDSGRGPGLGERLGRAVRLGCSPSGRAADRKRADPDPGDPGLARGRRSRGRRLTCHSELAVEDGAASSVAPSPARRQWQGPPQSSPTESGVAGTGGKTAGTIAVTGGKTAGNGAEVGPAMTGAEVGPAMTGQLRSVSSIRSVGQLVAASRVGSVPVDESM